MREGQWKPFLLGAVLILVAVLLVGATTGPSPGDYQLFLGEKLATGGLQDDRVENKLFLLDSSTGKTWVYWSHFKPGDDGKVVYEEGWAEVKR